MKRHGLWMLLGCLLPLLLIFLFPLLGIRGNWQFLIFILLMFACHLGMSGRHHAENHCEKGEDHDHHQG